MELQKILGRYENMYDSISHDCGKAHGGFKAFKKEHREKYKQCRKEGFIKVANWWISNLKAFSSKCGSIFPDKEQCLKRVGSDMKAAQKRLQRAQNKGY